MAHIVLRVIRTYNSILQEPTANRETPGDAKEFTVCVPKRRRGLRICPRGDACPRSNRFSSAISAGIQRLPRCEAFGSVAGRRDDGITRRRTAARNAPGDYGDRKATHRALRQ